MMKLLIATGLLMIMGMTGCKKFIEVDPPINSTNAGNVFKDDAAVAAVLTGVYTRLSRENINDFAANGLTSLSLFSSLSSDELTLYDHTEPTYSGYYQNALVSSSNVSTADYWSSIYPLIFIANAVVEGLHSGNSITPAVKQQLLGEAKFIRAFCFFYLVNLYGDVPLALTADWQGNSALTRSPQSAIYQQVIADLKDAEKDLSDSFLQADAMTPYPDGAVERVRPTKWAAAALLARVYLYTGDYVHAEEQASAVIGNTALFQLTSLNDVFLKNSEEAIWQLQPVGSDVNANTGEGKLFILPPEGPSASNPVYVSHDLLNSFEPGDQRREDWIDSVDVGGSIYFYPYKYKIGAVTSSAEEYSTILRLAEQYLIRAEARAQQNNISGAQEDLNIIRNRAQLANVTANDQAAMLTAVLQERNVELFTEWAHRWLDLKRTGSADSMMPPITSLKGGTWESTDQLYPIPLTELQHAPQLIQNPGY